MTPVAVNGPWSRNAWHCSSIPSTAASASISSRSAISSLPYSPGLHTTSFTISTWCRRAAAQRSPMSFIGIDHDARPQRGHPWRIEETHPTAANRLSAGISPSS
jgi:hypothetical protein